MASIAPRPKSAKGAQKPISNSSNLKNSNSSNGKISGNSSRKITNSSKSAKSANSSQNMAPPVAKRSKYVKFLDELLPINDNSIDPLNSEVLARISEELANDELALQQTRRKLVRMVVNQYYMKMTEKCKEENNEEKSNSLGVTPPKRKSQKDVAKQMIQAIANNKKDQLLSATNLEELMKVHGFAHKVLVEQLTLLEAKYKELWEYMKRRYFYYFKENHDSYFTYMSSVIKNTFDDGSAHTDTEAMLIVETEVRKLLTRTQFILAILNMTAGDFEKLWSIEFNENGTAKVPAFDNAKMVSSPNSVVNSMKLTSSMNSNGTRSMNNDGTKSLNIEKESLTAFSFHKSAAKVLGSNGIAEMLPKDADRELLIEFFTGYFGEAEKVTLDNSAKLKPFEMKTKQHKMEAKLKKTRQLKSLSVMQELAKTEKRRVDSEIRAVVDKAFVQFARKVQQYGMAGVISLSIDDAAAKDTPDDEEILFMMNNESTNVVFESGSQDLDFAFGSNSLNPGDGGNGSSSMMPDSSMIGLSMIYDSKTIGESQMPNMFSQFPTMFSKDEQKEFGKSTNQHLGKFLEASMMGGSNMFGNTNANNTLSINANNSDDKVVSLSVNFAAAAAALDENTHNDNDRSSGRKSGRNSLGIKIMGRNSLGMKGMGNMSNPSAVKVNSAVKMDIPNISFG